MMFLAIVFHKKLDLYLHFLLGVKQCSTKFSRFPEKRKNAYIDLSRM